MADNNTILEKLEGLVARFEEVSTLITDPAVIADQKRYVKLTKEYKELGDLMNARKEYMQVLGGIEEAKEIIANETDQEMREMADEIGLLVAHKPDSQDICFVSDGDYASYIEENSDAKITPGNFVLSDGTVVGKHKGIIHYTVGQRKGLGLSLGHPVFVLEIRPETNEVVVGSNEESMSRYVRADQVNFMTVEDLTEPKRVWAKIRYNHRGAWCTVEKTGEDEILCTFEEPQRAITPGQAVVFYDGDIVAGGATILRAANE